MKCPFALEPHQIQGLDYVHLFPIIQWLVKQAIQTREAEGDKVRQFAIRQYHKNSSSEEANTLQNGIENVREQSLPKRLYRKKHDDDDPELTMLEYGQRKIRYTMLCLSQRITFTLKKCSYIHFFKTITQNSFSIKFKILPYVYINDALLQN